MEDQSINTLSLLVKILETHTYKDVALTLNVAIGTVKRWIELKNVPKAYAFDLMKLASIDIDYSKFTFKEKDQFFTPCETAKYCYNITNKIIEKHGDNPAEYTFIEPSAGNGRFLKLLPANRRIGLDIEPKDEEIIQADYLHWLPLDNKKKYIVIGNPPFGLRGQLALKFINHSNTFADYVCFILPQLFDSDGKGVPRKRVVGFNLLYSEKLESDFESPKGKVIKVACIFQVWSKSHTDISYDMVKNSNTILKVYSLSDGGTPASTRNKKMHYKCDVYIPSTCFGKSNMRCYTTFEELPGRKGYGIVFIRNKPENIRKFKEIDWSVVAFLSTNSAYNIRTSQIKSQFIEG